MVTRLAGLVVMNVGRARRQFVLSAFGIAVGVAALAFFVALSAGVRAVVLGKVFRADRIEVEPARSSLDGAFGGTIGGTIGGIGALLTGGPRPLDDDTIAGLRAIPGVRAASPRMRFAFPARAWGGERLFGSARGGELVGDGLDPAAVAGEAIGPAAFADLDEGPHDRCDGDADCARAGEYCAWDVHQCQRPVPAIVSRFLVELYNATFARQHNLPRIDDFLLSRFKGFTFSIELGTSFVGPRAARGVPRQRRLMLVGVSARAIDIGVSVPLPYVRRWNAEYGGAGAAAGYSSVTVEVGDRRAITAVAARARALGLSVVDSGAEQAGLAITLVTLLFGLVSLAIVAVATINIAHTFFRAIVERRREIGVLRAVGASGADIRSMLLAEAGAVGLAGGAVGLGAARLLALAVDLASRRLVPDFPFKPASYFAFSPLLVAGVLLFAVAACLAGAALPARRAAALAPAEALAAV